MKFHELRPGVFAHCSGALWIADSRTAVIADLHLGFAWAQRRRGELWPLTDGGAQSLLLDICDTLQPQRLVLLGDITHAPRPTAEERQLCEATLRAAGERTELVYVRGNHDRRTPYELEWRTERIHALHGDLLPTGPRAEMTVVGHFHPMLKILDAARVKRPMRAFLFGNGLCVLPAFSPFAAGCNMRSDMAPELREWFGEEPVEVVLTSGERLAVLPPHRVYFDSFRALER